MYQKLIDKEAILAVIGLGYVGLPIALNLGKKVKVIADEGINLLVKEIV